MIRAINLMKAFSGKKVVNNISFDINFGDYVAIVGPSGSGKTTLLSLISGLIHLDIGELYFENVHLSKLSRTNWAKFRSYYIGLIFQFSELVQELTVKENILLPALFAGKLTEKDYNLRAESLIEKLNIREYENYRPMDLSGGQTQLVAIARSLINEPALLLADEPSGDLDPEHSKRIKALFYEYNKKGLTILLVTHDMKLAFDAKTIYKMKDGEFKNLIRGK
jgi:putative ABC transport system ATP-binding protein